MLRLLIVSDPEDFEATADMALQDAVANATGCTVTSIDAPGLREALNRVLFDATASQTNYTRGDDLDAYKALAAALGETDES